MKNSTSPKLRSMGGIFIDQAVLEQHLPKIGANAFALYCLMVLHVESHDSVDIHELGTQFGLDEAQTNAASDALQSAGLITVGSDYIINDVPPMEGAR